MDSCRHSSSLFTLVCQDTSAAVGCFATGAATVGPVSAAALAAGDVAGAAEVVGGMSTGAAPSRGWDPSDSRACDRWSSLSWASIVATGRTVRWSCSAVRAAAKPSFVGLSSSFCPEEGGCISGSERLDTSSRRCLAADCSVSRAMSTSHSSISLRTIASKAFGSSADMISSRAHSSSSQTDCKSSANEPPSSPPPSWALGRRCGLLPSPWSDDSSDIVGEGVAAPLAAGVATVAALTGRHRWRHSSKSSCHPARAVA